ncbi:MAG: phage holin family protein [Chthoniobacteraceae bacterium]
MKMFLIRWLCTTIAVAVAAWITGIQYSGFGSLLGAALLLGLVNAFLRPVLMLLSLPFILITLGFFILVVNALLFWFVSGLVPGFAVSGFWQAFFAALVTGIVNPILSRLLMGREMDERVIVHRAQVPFETYQAPPIESPSAGAKGKVIDIDVERQP